MNLRHVLAWLVVGSAGGQTRYRILQALKMFDALNAHRLARELGLDYTTVRYHLDKLVENRLVAHGEQSYQRTYFLTPAMQTEWAYFEQLTQRFRSESKREVPP